MKSQITSDTTATRVGSNVNQSVSTFVYETDTVTHTDYALGQALTVTVTVTSVNTVNGGSSITSLMTNTYAWGDGPLQSLVSYKPNVSSGPTNTSVYHYKRVGGQAQLISVTINDGRDRNDVIERHLRRFAFKEELSVRWVRRF